MYSYGTIPIKEYFLTTVKGKAEKARLYILALRSRQCMCKSNQKREDETFGVLLTGKFLHNNTGIMPAEAESIT